jgi:hypothetical protein
VVTLARLGQVEIRRTGRCSAGTAHQVAGLPLVLTVASSSAPLAGSAGASPAARGPAWRCLAARWC